MLSEEHGQIMALRQSIQRSRARLEVAIDKLEDLIALLVHPSEQAMQDRLKEVVLDLKYTMDFILGEPHS